MSNPLYIIGAGGHAKVVAAAALAAGWTIAGFADKGPKRYGEVFFGAPVLTEREIPAGSRVIVGLGHCARRLALAQELRSNGFELVTIIHPAASVSPSAKLDAGVFVGAGAVIDPAVSVGLAAIVNNGAIVCHDSTIGAGAHLCPGTVLAGAVKVGECAWIGLGSRVIEGLEIGEHVLLGAGSVVVDSVPPRVVAFGVPATVRRKLSPEVS